MSLDYQRIPQKISLFGLALLIGLLEKGGLTLLSVLEGPKLTIRKSYYRAINQKDVSDYYELLKTMNEKSARTILWRLTKKGLVDKKGKKYFLSKMGKEFIKKLLKPKKWDGKWRLVTFDIPEKMKRRRNWIRNELHLAQYKQLQKSVFIGKAPLERELLKEIIEKELYPYLKIMIIGEINDENILKNV